MAANQELVHYIQESLKDGSSEEQVRKDLLAHGWDKKDVDAAFASSNGDTSEAVVVPTNTSAAYKVRQAAKDAYVAIRNNLKAYLIILAVALAIALIFPLLFGVAAAAFAAQAISFGALILIGVVIFIALLAFQSVATGAMMLAVDDGAEGKKSDAGTLLRKAWSLVVRLFLTNLLVALVIAAPIVIAFVLFGLQNALRNGGDVVYDNTDPGGNILLFIVGMAAIVWAILASLRYFLATYVAVFEPEVPVTKTLSRSHYLVKDGGQKFMLKLIGLTIIAAMIISIIFGGGEQAQSAADTFGGDSKNPFVNFLTAALSLFVSAIIVLLYRNRRAIKK